MNAPPLSAASTRRSVERAKEQPAPHDPERPLDAVDGAERNNRGQLGQQKRAREPASLGAGDPVPEQEGARGQHERPLPAGDTWRQRPSDRDSERQQGKCCERNAIACKRARWQLRGDGLEQARYAHYE